MGESKIDWKAKLSSRKFWAGIAGWVTALLAAYGVADSTATQVSLIIVGVGSLAVYMLAEGMADRDRDIEVQLDFEGEISESEDE